jgi:hypothetical protein
MKKGGYKKSRKTEAQRKVTHARKYGAKSSLPKRQYKNR